ncbi:TetR/AcrR family transcriptional regulator [Agromyces tropicus]|uniref:TetR/AcrR family transcriptional regulator n=1 Tax=Agromyces tropicus TaxID=555371 RepID=UPI0031DFC371
MTRVDPEAPAESLGDDVASDAAPARLGRKRDHTRDPEILEAAIDVLAETGFEGMTIDMVATRARAGKATIYRRWPSKADLVLDAVACMKASELDADHLPDTGTLRGDLVAMIRPKTIEEAQRKLRIMAGLFGMISTTPELADAAHAAIIEPRAAVNRALLRRAIERGEVRDDVDVDLIASITPAMVAFRLLVERRPVDSGYLVSLIDGVLLPAAGVVPGPAAG